MPDVTADTLTLRAAGTQPQASRHGWGILIAGGLPLGEPVARYGPFVMNAKSEIIQAAEDFNDASSARCQDTATITCHTAVMPTPGSMTGPDSRTRAERRRPHIARTARVRQGAGP